MPCLLGHSWAATNDNRKAHACVRTAGKNRDWRSRVINHVLTCILRFGVTVACHTHIYGNTPTSFQRLQKWHAKDCPMMAMWVTETPSTTSWKVGKNLGFGKLLFKYKLTQRQKQILIHMVRNHDTDTPNLRRLSILKAECAASLSHHITFSIFNLTFYEIFVTLLLDAGKRRGSCLSQGRRNKKCPVL